MFTRTLLLLLLSRAILVAAEADKVLADYYRDVAVEIAKDPRKLGMDGVLKKYEELGNKHLLPRKEVLHKKAAADYLNLPLLDFVTLDKLERIAWVESKKFVDGNAIHSDRAKDAIDRVVLFFAPFGHGVPPFDRTVLSTLWWDPVRAAKTVRELSFRQHFAADEADRRKFVEQYSPPLLFRLGDDAENPGIAFFDGQEIFAVELKYMDIGIHGVTAIKWAKMK